MSTRRVAGLMMINLPTMTYRSRRNPQEALRIRLHELGASRVRFGYRRLTVMLRREGWRSTQNVSIGFTLRTAGQYGPRSARRSRDARGCQCFGQVDRTKSGAWTFSPRDYSTAAGSEY